MPGPRWNGFEADAKSAALIQSSHRYWIWVPAFAGMSGGGLVYPITTPGGGTLSSGTKKSGIRVAVGSTRYWSKSRTPSP